MNPTALIMMILSMGSVLTLAIFCVTKVLSLPPLDAEDHLHGPGEIDTGDTEDAD